MIQSTLKAHVAKKITDLYFTDKFCCLTDIPIKELAYHKEYYGDFAIGFKSSWVFGNFNPVLYINKNKIPNIVKDEPFEEIITPNSYYKSDETSFTIPINEIENAESPSILNSMKSFVDTRSSKYWLNFIKVTKFSDNPKKSFYREREWRHIGNIIFTNEDVEAIIIPKEYLSSIYKYINRSFIPINIITWEMLKKA